MKPTSIEESIVFNFLSSGVNPQAGYTHVCANDAVADAIAAMQNTADNPVYRPIKSNRVLAPLIVSMKKAVRKFMLKWYVEPFSLQQTSFNEAATGAVAGLNEKTNMIGHLKKAFDETTQQQAQYISELNEATHQQWQHLDGLGETTQQQSQHLAELNKTTQHQSQYINELSKNAKQQGQHLAELGQATQQQNHNLAELRNVFYDVTQQQSQNLAGLGKAFYQTAQRQGQHFAELGQAFHEATQQQGQHLAELGQAFHETTEQQGQRLAELGQAFHETAQQQGQRLAELSQGFNETAQQQGQRLTELGEAFNGNVQQQSQHIAEIGKAFHESVQRQDEKISTLERLISRYNEQFMVAQYKLERLELYDVFSDRHPTHEKRSFSQMGEDTILSMVFLLLKIPMSQTFYLDLGANHAKEINNTYFFYRQGARGVLVEANPALIPELKLYRNGDIVLNKCIAQKSGDKIPFYVMSGDGLSTALKESAEEFIAINPALTLEHVVEVETITVTDVIDQYFDNAPTLLSIDIEGKEEEVLRAIDFTKCRPTVIVCEMIPYIPNTLVTGQKDESIMKIMAENDYAEYAFTGINSIFVDNKRLEAAR
jgi:FkbM family methyltransferase